MGISLDMKKLFQAIRSHFCLFLIILLLFICTVDTMFKLNVWNKASAYNMANIPYSEDAASTSYKKNIFHKFLYNFCTSRTQ